MEKLEDKFFSRINFTSTCWEWTGWLNANGYGHFRYNNKVCGAHRIAAHLFFSMPLNFNLYVCHSCDNRKCVNPLHLFLGTAKENTNDALKKGRMKHGFKPGELSPVAKLTKLNVIFIRQNMNKISTTELARKFNVTNSTIICIKTKKSWKHLEVK